MPSSSSRRRHRRRRNKPPPPEAVGVPTGGAEPPRDAPSAVQHKSDGISRPAPPNPNPLEPQPHRAMPSSSSARRRHRRGCGRNKPPLAAPQPEAEEATRGGADPRWDEVLAILDRLGIPRPALPNPSPFDPQSHRATESSSSSRRRRRSRRGSKGPAAPAAVETRDWAELPLDVLCAVLHKLDHVEILTGAGLVCRSWRRAARDVPELWRRIDLRGHSEYSFDHYKLAQAAILRSAGQCEAYWGEHAADEDLLCFLGDLAPSLKSLRLISCHGVCVEGLAKAINKFPLLEELELSLCSNISGKNVFEVVGIACPQLRRFRLSKLRFYNEDSEYDYSFEDSDNEYRYNKDDEAQGIATMHELRSLQLFANHLTNEGLTVILDNCPHLESLDIRHCFNVFMNDTLRAKCSRIKALRLPYDSTDDYEFEALSPLWSRSDLYGIESDNDCVYGGPDYILDSDEYDDYCDPDRYLDGVYIGRRVTIMDLLNADY